jgi:hypothetical protein
MALNSSGVSYYLISRLPQPFPLRGLLASPRTNHRFVRFYRDYSIADFSFCTFFTMITIYGAFHTSASATVCEELSHHPDLMREVLEMGLSVENCEQWLERAVLGFVAFMIILVIIRLYFLLSIANYYSHLVRHQLSTMVLPTYRDLPNGSQSNSRGKPTRQRVFLLSRSPFYPEPLAEGNDEPIVYAPIPLSSLPEEVVQELKETASEAWVSHMEPTSASSCGHRSQRHHQHGHNHHHPLSRRSASIHSSQGRIEICPPVQPEESLLPEYSDEVAKV